MKLVFYCVIVSQKGVVEISKDASLLIDGNVRAYGSSSAYGGGGDGRIKNNGTLTVNDLTIDAYGYYTQNEESAILNVLGNLKFYYNPNITAGTIVFKGEEQQTVNGLRAFNIDVLNPKGIKYLSSIDVYGTYDLHGNPLDAGSYKTSFYENGAFGTLECNQSDWIIDENPSCGKAGSKHIECLICHEIVKQEEIQISTDHSWIFVSCEIARICEVCGAVEDAPLGHSFGDYVSNNDASCTEDGSKTRKCNRCGESDTTVDLNTKLGHSHSTEWTVDIEPTCTTVGSKSYHCSRCDDKADTTEIPSTGHTEEVVFGKIATCTEKGLTDGKKCTVCGTVIVIQQEVPAEGHVYESAVTAPSCVEKGYTMYTCACGDIYIADEVDARGHSYGDWIITKEPTDTEEGVREKICSACNYKLTESIPVIGETTSEETTAAEDTTVEDTTKIEDTSAEDTIEAVADESETEINEPTSEKKGGCRSTIDAGSIFAILVLCTFVFFNKKKN